jgi:Chitobiase/beta-hexosaminidase C-terminal domain/Bacterial Ig domain/Right handed beta helix region
MLHNGHDIVLSRLHVHDIGRSCTNTSNGLSGVFVQQPRVTITRSVFHDIGRYAKGENGCTISASLSQDHGVYVDGEYLSSSNPGASDTLISNNLFYRMRAGWGVQLYPGKLARISILNNTFAFANPSHAGQIVLGASTSDSRIANNIFYAPRTAAIFYYEGTQTNLQVRNNLVYNAAMMTETPPGTTVASTRQADPMLLNTTTAPYDFHVMSASSVIGAGLTFSEVPVDFEGRPRPAGGYDLGAYQYFAAAPAPAPAASVATPAITPNGGTISGPILVTLATATPGATIRYTIDGTTPSSASPAYTAPFTVSTSLTVRAQAFASGMTASQVAQAVFQMASAADTTAPTVAFTSPADGARVYGSTTFNVTASDNVGVVSVRFSVDGQTIATDTSAPFSAYYNFWRAASGYHSVTAVAKDAAGNTRSRTITVRR